MTEVPIEYRLLPVGSLENNSWNPNAMDQKDFDRLIKEIEDVGFIDPVAVVELDSGQFRLIGGEHRAAAARDLGMAEVPAVILRGPRFEGEELQKLLTVRLNVLRGKTNPEKMALLYNEMAKKYGEDSLQNLFAFSDKHGWKKLVSQIKRGLSQVGLPKEQREQFDESIKEAKTLQDLEKILNNLWSSYGDTISQSFMILVYGGREHIYISMDKKTRDAVKKLTKHCKAHGRDINEELGPALCALAELLEEHDAPERSQSQAEDDVAF